jgi:hypothetical protein
MLLASCLAAASFAFVHAVKLAMEGEVRSGRFSEVEGHDDDA